jgi:hypothetical protein
MVEQHTDDFRGAAGGWIHGRNNVQDAHKEVTA